MWGIKKYGITETTTDKITAIIKHIDTFTVKTTNGGYHLYFYSNYTADKIHCNTQDTSLDIDI